MELDEDKPKTKNKKKTKKMRKMSNAGVSGCCISCVQDILITFQRRELTKVELRFFVSFCSFDGLNSNNNYTTKHGA